MAETTPGQSGSAIEALADQCVMCGLCLPHCPTYALDRHESESPRGRIVLARQFARGALQPTAEAVAHLDRCLGCLSCQAVCPSGVRYEAILVQSRALLAPLRPAPGPLRRWLTQPARLRRLAALSAFVRAERWLPRLGRWLPAASPLRRLALEVPAAPKPLASSTRNPPNAAPRGPLTLFPGCIASVFDRDTLAAGRVLLEALGYEVRLPQGTVCCGALALHAGDSAGAAASAAGTRAALESLGADRVLVSASGCLGSLRDHALAGSHLEVEDILAFVARDPGLETLRFRPLAARAALHLPCTQLNGGSGAAPIRALLGRIPGLEVLELPAQPRCCGAAGSYFLEHADQADRLRADRLDQVVAQAPDLLLTSNIGCRIFLGNGLRQRASAVPVRHPLAMLAMQLETARP
ncbi:(Fe-S)-binding protein [Dokdonella immobilis]|uniref:Glycolate oxidase iron-sulfur subunit n=1 Tax=Dokdonella immobilis TaxID=578942 RepID=A0A1I4X9T3_9GAMM|nr:(Fe-S)-binding protein [Dokdonella immobilis]SFN22236.1 glycolate oxidase iron-sulfur subunit [Dokdonella immobilis]